MTNDDKMHHHERISALHEAFGKACTSRTLAIYWEALSYLSVDDFDAAYERAARELRRPASPVELREFARDNGKIRAQVQHEVKASLCHFHGDGEFEPMGRGRPDEPSTNRTAWWCQRCTHFVTRGLQRPDLKGVPSLQVVRELADSKDINHPEEP